jgi:hypothetical protein
MTAHTPITLPLKTKDINVMSHVTSITVTGDKISKLPATSVDKPGVIHLTLAVKDNKDEPCILAGAEELCLVIDPADALELGLLLLEMEIEQQKPEELRGIQARLSALLQKPNTIV